MKSNAETVALKIHGTSHLIIHRGKHFSLGLYLTPQNQPQVCCRSNCEREHDKLPRRQHPGEQSERELGRDAFGDKETGVKHSCFRERKNSHVRLCLGHVPSSFSALETFSTKMFRQKYSKGERNFPWCFSREALHRYPACSRSSDTYFIRGGFLRWTMHRAKCAATIFLFICISARGWDLWASHHGNSHTRKSTL